MGTTYIDDLKAKLHDIDMRLRDQRRAIENGPVEERAAALAELERLELKREEISRRLLKAEAEGADKWSELHKGFREEIDGLTDTIERWILRLGQV
ncbi:hypothetical protein SAMN05216257_102237 [Meinhardsimonia xiamenensis]|jgi:hypothetical protein|uniref:Uncharacterized protein n=1 Tax=Meinhardsimonia xiamenensis TaxID=990712 RepID=A0A1G9AQ33_9RHOB|nr:hypothetical protein [Meinhardsimonia xiamenensis]PRX35287.1 hypothetical protein LV81_01882 [Meinhardsimonia xiamenensis]SDK29489.1 hypothetical protein SAMN05216257_102237 [Meinhardsimonia xiamenensis]